MEVETDREKGKRAVVNVLYVPFKIKAATT